MSHPAMGRKRRGKGERRGRCYASLLLPPSLIRFLVALRGTIGDAMCGGDRLVIVTTRTILWSLLSVASSLGLLASVLSPQWLLGPLPESSLRFNRSGTDVEGGRGSEGERLWRSLSLWLQCHMVDRGLRDYDWILRKAEDPGKVHISPNCSPFVSFPDFKADNDHFPHAWKVSVIFLALGVVLSTCLAFSSFFCSCLQSVCKKSLFPIAGFLQALAGLMLIVSLVLFPAGWTGQRVKEVCGARVAPFTISTCSLGWGFMLACGSTLLTLMTAWLSIEADKSTSSDKVQHKIDKGRTFICLL
ncbi:unnamed protein product [Darwinula stevensoni]|uniref:Lipoma HMGIC fusion partner-like 2 protein n=1 Tax=Darwinula stevensoni TaxID=69355 RepID=A0A7R8X6P9_9CRUS|nr:unnamed protein product [Darwinula stevensoni]CAG0882339.1 unnamed protein product [Darwinula stevensoni]